MKTFRVYYWKERNDECVDCEIDIEAKDLFELPFIFEKKVRLGKINRIEELP